MFYFKSIYMKTNIETVGDTRKKISVSFEAKEVAAEREGVVADFVQHAKIPGFRPGKAPADMITKRYEAEIKDQLERALINKAAGELNNIKDFDIYNIVDINHGDLSSEDGMTLEFTADVYPEIKLPEDYKTEVELASEKPTEEEIQKTVDFYRNQRAQYNAVDREVKKGDFVQVSYAGTVDGTPVEELMENAAMFGAQKGTWEEAGNTEVPGVKAVVEGVVGMKKGDKKTVEHEFPKDFHEEKLAGKKAVYELELEDIREKVLPEINEEFLKGLDAKTEEELRERLAKDIEQEKIQHNEVMKRQKAVETLMDKVDFPLPESALEEERQAVLQDMMMRFMSSGATRDNLETNKEALFDAASKEAEPRAKMRIFLNRVAKANDLKVTDEDMSRMLWQEAVRTRTKPDEIVKQIRKDQGRLNRMRADALLQKAINFIAEKAEVKQA